MYDEKIFCWYVFRNFIFKGKMLEENWDNVVEVLEMIVKGEIEFNLGDEDVLNRFLRVFKRNLL